MKTVKIPLTQGQFSLIDADDENRVKKHIWCAAWCKRKKCFTALTSVYRKRDGKSVREKTLRLHRFIMNCPEGLQVDHVNHNTLDNRKRNLRVVTNAQNQQNKMGANRTNIHSGIRNISKNSTGWIVRVMLNRNSHYFGWFKDLREAERVAVAARKKLMPFSVDECKIMSNRMKERKSWVRRCRRLKKEAEARGMLPAPQGGAR